MFFSLNGHLIRGKKLISKTNGYFCMGASSVKIFFFILPTQQRSTKRKNFVLKRFFSLLEQLLFRRASCAGKLTRTQILFMQILTNVQGFFSGCFHHNVFKEGVTAQEWSYSNMLSQIYHLVESGCQDWCVGEKYQFQTAYFCPYRSPRIFCKNKRKKAIHQ